MDKLPKEFTSTKDTYYAALILNLYPPPVKHFMCQMVYFCAKTNTFYSIFSWGGPQTQPLLLIFHSVLTVCWKKKKKLRGTNKKSHKQILVKPHYLPPPPLRLFFFFFFFAC